MDYTKYSKQPVEEKIEEVVEEVVEIEPVVEEIVEEEPEVVYKTGVVTDCMKLKIRNTPKQDSTDSNVICTIPCLTKVMIDENESTANFYKVYMVSGIEGYCMKKFITIFE